MLVDTHCHIHEADYPLPVDDVVARAREAGVDALFCVGTSEASSAAAISFAATHDAAYAIVGVHPHDVKDGYDSIRLLTQSASGDSKIIGVGEIGLDYFYNHSPREIQIRALEEQLQMAHDASLPVSFHVREAFEDFWPILDNFPGTKGVLHSFTDGSHNAEEALRRGLFIGINGISTFTKDQKQRELFTSLPLERLLLETDAPFLTPVPFRGKINEPALVSEVAKFHASERNISLEEIAAVTTANAHAVFAF